MTAERRSVPPPPPQTPRKPAINWEHFMGVKLFAWLGGLALFLSAVFFIKLSIQQGWIPAEVRVALGYLLGIGLLAGGVVLSRRRYEVTAQTFCATGVVTLYAMTFASKALYGFFEPGLTFGLMVLITATAFLLAVRLEARVVALLGMLGGFLTPVLLSTGQDNPLGLFGYIALLDAGLIAVALHRRWYFLVPLAALCTAGMEIGWADKFLNNEKTLTAIVVCLAFDALFTGAFAAGLRRGAREALLSLSAAGLVLVSFGFALYLGLDFAVGLQPGRWLGFVFLSDLCLLALVALGENRFRLAGLAGAIVFGLLGAWTFSRLNAALLPWALGSFLVYAVLHSAFPLVLRRLRPGSVPDRFANLFAPLSLLLVLGPVLNSSFASLAVWPAILLLDLVAIGLAWATASLAGVVMVLILTLIAAGQSILLAPRASGGSSLLWIVAGFALLFYVVGLVFGRRAGAGKAAGEAAERKLKAQLPAFSALLPFVLLVMATGRLSLPAPGAIFGLSLLLAVLTLGLSRLLQLGSLPSLALAGVLAVIYTWHGAHFTPAAGAMMVLWLAVFHALFSSFPFLFHRHFLERRGPWLAAALAGPLLFPVTFLVVKRTWPNDLMGLLPALFALPPLLSVLLLVRSDPAGHPRRLGRLALFGGIALLFITLIFPIQFERQWITIAWALEGVALLWLFGRVPHRGLPLAAMALFGTAFARLALNPAVFHYQLHSGTPILNGYLYTYGIVILCLLAGARLMPHEPVPVAGRHASGWLNAFAGILIFLLLNIEIADYFTREGSTTTFEFSGNFARDLAYTIVWALYALVLLVLGIWKRARLVRYAAIGLLVLTLLKLFFHDLAQLAQLYRIVALFAVAVIAILASFLYQRFLPTDEKQPPANP